MASTPLNSGADNSADPETDPDQEIQLVMDVSALRQQLRHAFATHFTVVQELFQNGRRAGATAIRVEYDDVDKRLVVEDDGCGIEDFQTLLTFARSGWDAETMASERPYGMGFLAAIYEAEHVTIDSRGKRLRFDTEGVLSDQCYSLEPSSRTEPGTRVELDGVALEDASGLLRRLADGYPIPIVFHGEVLPSSRSIRTGDFVSTDVGEIRIGGVYEDGSFSAYLQGFQVYGGRRSWGVDVVHLDGKRYRGKFPDRDRCIDEQQMVAEVSAAIKRVYEARLREMKATMTPAEFCRQGYDLAARLGCLDIFNDVPAIPREWLATFAEMPRTELDDDEIPIEGVQTDVTGSQVEAGQVSVYYGGHFCRRGFDALEDECSEDGTGQDQLMWVYLYVGRRLILNKRLHEMHWLRSYVQQYDSADVVVKTEGVREEGVDPLNTSWIGAIRVMLCESITLSHGEDVIRVREPFATIVGEDVAIMIPRIVGPDGTVRGWAEVGPSCLRQITSYRGNGDRLDEDGIKTDLREVERVVRLLGTDSAEMHLQQLLSSALRGYSDELKRFDTVSFRVHQGGSITIEALTEAAPAGG